MRRTIKELSDALGVSKTAVRKHMTEEFRENHTETDRNGVITISPDGCKLIAERLGRSEKLTESHENKIPETKETTGNTDNMVIPRVVWDMLQDQLREKDRQLAVKDQQISQLTKLADQAQQLHAGAIKKLPEGEPDQVLTVTPEPSEPASPPGFWGKVRDFFR